MNPPVRLNRWLLTLATIAATFLAFTPNLVSAGTVVAWGSNLYGQTDVPPGLDGVMAIAAGQLTTMALKQDGRFVAWGITNKAPKNLNGVVAVAEGAYHTLALRNSGEVFAWSFNGSGQTNVPADLQGVVAISAGYNHSLALKSDGTVVGWGDSRMGGLPVPAGLTNVTAIAAGWTHSVALKNDGTVVQWGTTGPGQISVPLGLNGVVAIAAGNEQTLALKSDGTVVAWGFNNGYQQQGFPNGLNGVKAIATGNSQTVVIRTNGTLLAWGNNTRGQTDVPPGLSGVTAVACGQDHTVALLGDGGVDPGPRLAAATVQVVNGSVAGVTLIDRGNGYASARPPNVVLASGGGTGALAHAVVDNGEIQKIVIDNPGGGYTNRIFVGIDSPPIPSSLSLEVIKIRVTMSVIPGRNYRLNYTTDFVNWYYLGELFLADSDTITQEIDVTDKSRYLRIQEVY